MQSNESQAANDRPGPQNTKRKENEPHVLVYICLVSVPIYRRAVLLELITCRTRPEAGAPLDYMVVCVRLSFICG